MNFLRFLKQYKNFGHAILFPFCMYLVMNYSPMKNVKKLTRFSSDIKHILLWTDIYGLNPEGQSSLVEQKCEYLNCYLTKNRTLFGDIRYFDLILFNAQDVSKNIEELPTVRGHNQKFVFVANDSSDNFPVCDSVYDHFFNWTWTFRFDSSLPYKFFSIQNYQYEELGNYFQWNYDMKPIDDKMKMKFSTKSRAAAIFLDKCSTRSKVEYLVKDLQYALARYNLTVDVYGKCGTKKCKRRTMTPCFWRVKKMYYFYLAFEDSIAYDYVTDVVLHAYNNDAVPIVFGGARYDRFLPPGSYINAVNQTAEILATKMHNIINNREKYYDYFRWKNYYIISKTTPIDVCTLCGYLNYPMRLLQWSSYNHFRLWWNADYEKRCAFKDENSML